MGLLPPVIVEIQANAQELMAKLGEVQGKIEETASQGASHFDKLKSAIGPATIAIGGTVTAAALLAEHLSQPIEQARKQLEQALTDAGSSMEEYKGQIGKTEDAMRNFGHSQSDTDQALQKLTQGLQDPKKAIADMGIVADLAAAKHISLADAADKVVKITAGNTKVLKEFGIQAGAAGAADKALAAASKEAESAATADAKAKQHLADVHAMLAGKTKLTASEQISLRNAQDAVTAADGKMVAAHDKLDRAQQAVADGAGTADTNLDQLAKRIHGQAAAAVDTFGGRIEVLKTKIEDWVGVHAQKLIPILTVTGPALAGVGGIIQSGVIPAVVKAIAAMGEMVVQAVVWSASMIASAVAAVASWVASMAVMAASAIAAGVAMLLPFLPIILILAAVGAAAYLLYRNWDTVFGFVKEITSDVVGWVTDHLSLIIDVALGPLGIAINLLRDHWSEVWGAVKTVVEDVWDFVRPIFERIIQGVKDVTDGVGKVVGIVEKVGGVAGGVLSHIPGFADGGVVPGPQGAPMLAIVHGGETVVPPGGIVTGGGSSSAGGGVAIHVHVTGALVGTMQQLAELVTPAIVNAMNTGARRGTNYTTAFGLS